MPHTDVIPTSASTASTGFGIRYVGAGNRQFAYAYSGIISVNNVETTLLEFTTGSGVIDTIIQFSEFTTLATSRDFRYKIYLNDLVVAGVGINSGLVPDVRIPAYLILPPLTLVKCTARNTIDSDAHDQVATMRGRVYGAE